MTKMPGGRAPRDEDLVAYLDGELTAEERAWISATIAADADVALRLAALSRSTIGMRDAFDPLLAAAPMARLDRMLAALEGPGAERPHVATRAAGWTRRHMLAATIALIACGGLVDHLILAPPAVIVSESAGHWRGIVADYLRLYTPETLANIPDDPGLRARELASVGAGIGLRLTPDMIALASIPLKHSQILRYDRKPLAQITYLDPRYGPMALCIVPSGDPASPPRVETRHGLNVAYWNDGQHGFMVIGAGPDLATIARALAGRITS